MRNRKRNRRGFTIAEIIVVVIIIGVLATIVATRLLPRVTQAKQTAAGSNAAALAGAVEGYWADCGAPPSGASLESICFDKPSDPAMAEKWHGPYLKNRDQLMDPWGKPFVLKIPGEKNTDFDVISYGSDGQPGGDGEAKDIIKP